MNDMVRKLIQDRLTELKITRKQLSVALDRDAGYISQFLVRGVPEELDERDRRIIADVLKVPEESLRGPSALLPKRRYEKKAGTTRDGLIEPTTHPAHGAPAAGPARLVPNSELFGLQADLPVYGTAQGGPDGAEIVSEYAVDYVARPVMLLKVRDAYGMIVTGDSMSPEHKPGSTALVNPHLPPRVGDTCVFRNETGGTTVALIKEYRGQTDTLWRVRQHNPQKDFTLKKSEWKVAGRTVGNYAA
ncbi:S24 family peptidase [Bradyrhizobium ivorense]|uniref:S24 family peptidase n=1 Tax=Bradyrhizobium ivorense TaxID=2511166 RepID=UPI0010B53D3F|nr:S24 family peptidase [Bradyrhizobium ivorense]VIO73856.1 hypothetical protein CI41S_39650 [Bradyrhizobium ivorense]